MTIVKSCCCGCSLAEGTVGTGIFFVFRSIFLFGLGFYCMHMGSKYEASSLPWSVGLGLVIAGIILLIPTILLFVSVRTKCRYYSLPWLIIEGILLGLSVVSMVRLLVAFGAVKEFFIQLAICCLLVYLYIVVLSYFKSLRNVNQGLVVFGAVVTVSNQPGYTILSSQSSNIPVGPSQKMNQFQPTSPDGMQNV